MSEKRISLSDFDPSLLGEVRTLLAQARGTTPEAVSEAELLDWLQAVAEELTEECFPARLARLAQEAPGAPAVESVDGTLSYGELVLRAHALAEKLLALGASGQVVGLCLPRSPELVVGLTGILAARAAVLAIDATWPAPWIDGRLRDARVELVVGAPRLAERPGFAGRRIVSLDEAAVGAATYEPRGGDEDRAYVSFGLGRQGAAVSHRALRERLEWLRRHCALSAGDGVLHGSPVWRDGYLWEALLPLWCGARLVLRTADEADDMAALVRWMAGARVSVAHFTPSELERWLAVLPRYGTGLGSQGGQGERGAALELAVRHVLTSGEPLVQSTVETFFDRVTAELTYLYDAPPEVGLVACAHPCRAGDAEGPVPLGRPAAAGVYVVDESSAPVPVGARGEIAVAVSPVAHECGPGAHAHGHGHGGTGARGAVVSNGLVRTGDLGQRAADGSLRLLGGRGRLTWVGGAHIDLGEVEAELLAENWVGDCAVLARECMAEGRQLVAYVVPSGPLGFEALRAFLAARLPAALVPRALVPVHRLPLTPSGQLDVEALERVPLLDEALGIHWEALARSSSFTARGVAVIRDVEVAVGTLHLSELLPGWSRDAGEVAAVGAKTATARAPRAASSRPAICHGPPLDEDAGAPATLVELLERTVRQWPEQTLRYLLPDGREVTQSYRELAAEAGRIASGLRRRGLERGQPILMQLELHQDFIPGFWGAVLAGLVPVPVAVPARYDEGDGGVSRLEGAWHLLGQPCILTTEARRAAIERLGERLGERAAFAGLRVLGVEELRACGPDGDGVVAGGRGEDLALILLTSGSTGKPKGVMLSHRNVCGQARASVRALDLGPEDVSFNWMAMDHVAGLVMFHVRDTYVGGAQIHAPPQYILEDPLRWLEGLERFAVTMSFAPNFAYALLVERAAEIERRRFRLGHVRYLENAGEAIVSRTAQRVLALLEPQGLPASAMLPAWGMSETTSMATVSRRFRRDTTGDEDPFVDLGPPVAGVSLRVVDEEERPVTEGVVGRLQVRGPLVTSGYYRSPEATAAAFTADGWFKTGDLGYLWDGCLFLTGREKDVIIVNGINYHAHEIEPVVEALPGVVASFTAACAIRRPGSATDALALFFHTDIHDEARLAELLHEIRAAVLRKVGLHVDHLVPVEPSAVPKTGLGKIQRALLVERFRRGEFEAELKRVDLITRNANTMPDWFYRRIWRRKEPPRQLAERPGWDLVFLDREGVGQALCERLGALGRRLVQVDLTGLTGQAGPAREFVRLGVDRYGLQPGEPTHYLRLLEALDADGVVPERILHLGTYGPARDFTEAEALWQAHEAGLHSLSALVRALAGWMRRPLTLQLLVATSHATPVLPDAKEPLACERAALPGLLKTIPQELPGIRCALIDLAPEAPEVAAARLVAELGVGRGDLEVAYRGGKRYVPRLERVDLAREARSEPPPLEREGCYLLTGGLGGIGSLLARHLVTHYQARLLIVGRTALSEGDSEEGTEGSGEVPPHVAERRATLAALRAAGGDVLYEAADVGDYTSLAVAVARAEAHFGRRLTGVFHLAATVEARMLAEETRESLERALRAKVLGTFNLYRLTQERPGLSVVACSSVNGLFGGALVGAYAAASAFEAAYALHRRQHDRPGSRSIAFSLWEGLGLARGFRMGEAQHAKGFLALAPTTGLRALEAALAVDVPQLAVGLHGGRPAILRHLVREAPLEARRLTLFYTPHTSKTGGASGSLLGPTEFGELPRDIVGKPVAAELIRVAELPSGSAGSEGEIDRAQLVARHRGRSGREREAPRDDVERQLAAIFCQVLGLAQVGIHRSFFELGGQSLLAAQVTARVREVFGIDVPLGRLFSASTVAELAQVLTEYERVPGQVAQAQTAAGPAAELPTIVPAPEALYEPFPLTDMQEAYWVAHSDFYGTGGPPPSGYLELEGASLDVERFTAAWRRLIERHPMLRAFMVPSGGQQVLPTLPPFAIPVADLRALPADEAEARLGELRRRMEAGPRGPGALERPPLLNLAVSLLPGRVRVHLSVSPLIADGLSIELLFEELYQLYHHPGATLAPLELSFRDVVRALASLRDGEPYRRAAAYWQSRLPTLPPPPELPYARDVASGGAPGVFHRRVGRLPPATWQRLKARAARAELTPNTLLCAAYADVLATWSRTRRFTLNLMSFSRPPLHPQIHEVVGNFSSPVLLAVEVAARTGFTERARRLQAQLWQDLDQTLHSGIQVMRELNRRAAHAARATMPIVFASLVGGQRVRPSIVGTLLAPVYSSLRTPQVWLDHQVYEEEGALVFHWDALDARFREGVVDEMFRAYERHLGRLGEDEAAWERPWLDLAPPLASTEPSDLQPPPDPQLLHTLLEVQARRQPDAPAVLAADRCLSHGELDRLATRLAHRLRHEGVTPETLVAVVMEKGWEQIVAAVAILKAGAAYVPIDAALPAQRIQLLLEQSQARVALTQARLEGRLAWPAALRVLPIAPSEAPGEEVPPLAPCQRPESLAYVIFTSGSTGLPKGVMIEHRGAVNTCLDMNHRFGVGPADRVLALSSLSFDLSVYDLFGVLGAGGAVVLPTVQGEREPAHWIEEMERHGVTLWNSVPALMELLVEYLIGRGERLPGALRRVFLSGDWIPLALPERIRALSQAAVISLGGATEASIWSILHPIEWTDPTWPTWSSIPYGRAMAHQTVQVLDEALEPRPVGVPGHLYIGGLGLARGYWRDEQKTRAAFIVHPRSGERLYRTGDLGCYRPDGSIEFLGREDAQVKIQGFRIELGEIEATLAEHPAVRAAVVVVIPAMSGGVAGGGAVPERKQLVAYVVPHEGRTAELDGIERFLRERLPAYMIPTSLVALDALPMTPNGKIDRAALSARDATDRLSASPHLSPRTPPRTQIERELAALWEEVLAVQPVGVRDDFFQLGGHSLGAVRLMLRIEQRYGHRLPTSVLLEDRTIERLAARLGQAPESPGSHDSHEPRTWSPAVVLQPHGEAPPLFFVHPIGGGVLGYAELARHLGARRPFIALQARGFEDDAEPIAKIEEMARLYLSGVRRHAATGPYLLAGWSFGAAVAFEMARQLRQAGEDIAFLGLLDPYALPTRESAFAALDEAGLLVAFLADLAAQSGRSLGIGQDPRWAGLTSLEERLGFALAEAHRAAVLPRELGLVHLQRRLAVFRAHREAARIYVAPPSALPAVLLRAAEGASPSAPSSGAAGFDEGWSAATHGQLLVHTVPGNHYSMLAPPLVQALSTQLQACLADAVRRTAK